MGALLPLALRVLAGVGIGELIDKVFPGKIEKPYSADKNRMPKLLIWAAVVAGGALAFSFLSKKLKLKL
jgi:hypothetical protein